MRTIGGRVHLELSLEEVNYINKLIKRDRQALLKEHKGAHMNYYKCPICKSVVLKDSKFCCMCGQRLDIDNIAL